MAIPWRFIDSGKNNAYLNMAIDEALLLEYQKFPVLRFYEFEKAVSIGVFQKLSKELNQAACIDKGFDVVRRPTGGGVVFHGDNVELTYSLIFPQELKDESVLESYKKVHEALILAFSKCGIVSGHSINKSDATVPDLCFIKPTKYDVLVDLKKIAGAAQRRKNKQILHQGYIFFHKAKMDLFCAVLNSRNSKSYLEQVKNSISFSALSSESREELKQKIKSSVALLFAAEFEDSGLTLSEEKVAFELYETKYKLKKWNSKY